MLEAARKVGENIEVDTEILYCPSALLSKQGRKTRSHRGTTPESTKNSASAYFEKAAWPPDWTGKRTSRLSNSSPSSMWQMQSADPRQEYETKARPMLDNKAHRVRGGNTHSLTSGPPRQPQFHAYAPRLIVCCEFLAFVCAIRWYFYIHEPDIHPDPKIKLNPTILRTAACRVEAPIRALILTLDVEVVSVKPLL